MLAESKTSEPRACEPAELTVAFLTPSLSRQAGGIFEIERCLALHLIRHQGVDVQAFGAADAAYADDEPLWSPLQPCARDYIGPAQFRWSPALAREFAECRADVGHLHALWMHTSLIMRRWSRRQRRPYLTTINGMLDAWALKNSAWKKRLSAFAYERDCLDRAGCLQANTRHELEAARSFGLRNPICIIPNGVDLPTVDGDASTGAPPPGRTRRTLLYLGRLHPKKGLANLLQAWARLGSDDGSARRDWELVFAGWDQLGHEAELKSLAANLGIANDTRFVGPAFGAAKLAAFRNADAFVLPSLSEGLPMVVLEAWSYAKPVIMTPQCNLPEGFAADAAVSAQPNADSLVNALRQILEMSDQQRAVMGQRGLELVKQRFTWEQVAEQMLSVYRWLAGGGAAPSCVVQH